MTKGDILSYFECIGYSAQAWECRRGTGRGLAESARPTALEDLTEPLKMSIYGRPIMKGVDDAKRPSFGIKISSENRAGKRDGLGLHG